MEDCSTSKPDAQEDCKKFSKSTFVDISRNILPRCVMSAGQGQDEAAINNRSTSVLNSKRLPGRTVLEILPYEKIHTMKNLYQLETQTCLTFQDEVKKYLRDRGVMNGTLGKAVGTMKRLFPGKTNALNLLFDDIVTPRNDVQHRNNQPLYVYKGMVKRREEIKNGIKYIFERGIVARLERQHEGKEIPKRYVQISTIGFCFHPHFRIIFSKCTPRT